MNSLERETFATLDSTNAEAMRQGLAGVRGPKWILALAQTSARGRRGRSWSMGAGNFAATLLMSVAGGPGQAALRSFVAALALRDAFVACTGRAEAFTLKWPNDVLLHGRKLAGILLESSGRHLCIGIGVNLAAVPDVTDLEAGALKPVSLRESFGVSIAPEEFLELLAPAFAGWEAKLAGEGFAPVRAAWLLGAAKLGERISAKLPNQSYHGIFETIDDTGALVLATDTGRVTLPAAEVHFAFEEAV